MQRQYALLLLVFITLVWGSNWVIVKLTILSVPPIWTMALRSIIATVVILGLQLMTKQYIIPKKHDISIIFVVAIFHMTIFAVLMGVGLQYASVGRSAVLGYTTPLWVTPAAIWILHEPATRLKMLGVGLGILGVLILFDPFSFAPKSSDELFGNALLLLASFSWAITIIFIKMHTWQSTPFQLVFWQNLVASFIMVFLAFFMEGVPHFTFTTDIMLLLAYNGILATALGFWVMTVINRHLSAIVTSLGMLATPVVGIVCSQIVLGEQIDMSLIVAGIIIFVGIVLGCLPVKNAK